MSVGRLGVAVGVLALAFGCSSDDGDKTGNDGAAASGNGTGASGDGTGVGGLGSDIGGGGSSADGSGTGTGATGDGSAAATGGAGSGMGGFLGGAGTCESISSQGQLVPPVLEFVVDITGSMDDDAYPGTNNSATKWEEMQRVLPDAIGSLPSEWAVGITFYNFSMTARDGCFAGEQAVDIAPLDAGQVSNIDSAIQSQRPQDYTPTMAAWRFGLAQLEAWNAPAAYAQSPRYIVLITDGVPTVTNDGCEVDNPISQSEYDALVSNVAAEGAAANVQTFVVGVLGSEDPQGATYDPIYMLSQLAIAGGTEQPPGCVPTSGTVNRNSVSPRGTYCHFDMTSNPDFAGGLTIALGSIASQVESCSYTVPTPAAGLIIDPNGIAVTLYSGGGAATLLNRASSAACADGDWYVSAETSGFPTQIDLCPGTCDLTLNDPNTAVEITFTCVDVG